MLWPASTVCLTCPKCYHNKAWVLSDKSLTWTQIISFAPTALFSLKVLQIEALNGNADIGAMTKEQQWPGDLLSFQQTMAFKYTITRLNTSIYDKLQLLAI